MDLRGGGKSSIWRRTGRGCVCLLSCVLWFEWALGCVCVCVTPVEPLSSSFYISYFQILLNLHEIKVLKLTYDVFAVWYFKGIIWHSGTVQKARGECRLIHGSQCGMAWRSKIPSGCNWFNYNYNQSCDVAMKDTKLQDWGSARCFLNH